VAEPLLRIEVVHALPRRYWSEWLELPAGSTVADALERTSLPHKVPGLVIDPALVAVHGQAAKPDQALHDGDRVELLRPLACDPKEVRRRRAAAQAAQAESVAQRRRRRSLSPRGMLP